MPIPPSDTKAGLDLDIQGIPLMNQNQNDSAEQSNPGEPPV